MRLEKSIIRRSLPVTLFYVAGHGFNYLYLITANRMLGPAVFGLLYISISIINVMATPGPILGMSFGQHFASLAASAGPGAVTTQLRRILSLTARWSGLIIVGLAMLLALIGHQIGIDSYAIVALIPAASCASIICEVVRAGLQGTQRFTWFGLIWVLWNALNYAFATVGLYLFGTVWAALAGALLATLVAISTALVYLARHSGRPSPAAAEQAPTLPVKPDAMISQLLGYGLFNCLLNGDVLLGYLVLSHEQVGIYVASSILPKAIVMMTLPVAQVLLPVIAAHTNAGESARFSTVKALVGVSLLATTGVLILRMSGGFVCDTRFGIRFCDFGVMATLAPAAIGLSVLRVLIVNSLALRKSWPLLLQALALAVLAIFAGAAAKGGPQALATLYIALCSTVTFVYIAIDLTFEFRFRRIRLRY